MMTARSLFDAPPPPPQPPVQLGLFCPDESEDDSIEMASHQEASAPQQQPPPPTVGPHSTLRECFLAHVLPELEIEPKTLELYEGMLNRWEQYTDNTPVSQIDREMVKAFRTKLVERPYKRGKTWHKRSPETVNKIMRMFSAAISPLWPADRHNTGGKGFVPFFKKLKALRRQKKLPFTFSRAELSAMYLNCSACKPTGGYRKTALYEPHLWRTALVLALNTGPRTWDLYALKWEDVRWDDFRYGSVFYQSRKNSKIQRPPLNEVARQHLEHLRSLKLDEVHVFPQFKKNKSFYAAWDRICAKAGVDAVFESFRKTCSTFHEDVIKGVGAFITGHDLKGVNAQFYDNPTKRVMRAVYRMKNPVEFRRGAKLLSAVST